MHAIAFSEMRGCLGRGGPKVLGSERCGKGVLSVLAWKSH